MDPLNTDMLPFADLKDLLPPKIWPTFLLKQIQKVRNLPAISKVITPLAGVISPGKPIYFRPFTGVITPFITFVGGPPCKFFKINGYSYIPRMGWHFFRWATLNFHEVFIHSRKTNSKSPWQLMVGRWISFWDGPFSGDMLIFRRVRPPKRKPGSPQKQLLECWRWTKLGNRIKQKMKVPAISFRWV